VKVTAGDLVLVDEVHSGRGYQSDYGRQLHFGLGKHEKIERVEIQWPSGQKQVVQDPPVNQQIIVKEGNSLIR
jgi:hypothetical protein